MRSTAALRVSRLIGGGKPARVSKTSTPVAASTTATTAKDDSLLVNPQAAVTVTAVVGQAANARLIKKSLASDRLSVAFDAKQKKLPAEQLSARMSLPRPAATPDRLTVPAQGLTVGDLHQAVHSAVKRAKLEKKQTLAFSVDRAFPTTVALEEEQTGTGLLLSPETVSDAALGKAAAVEQMAAQCVLSLYSYSRLKKKEGEEQPGKGSKPQTPSAEAAAAVLNVQLVGPTRGTATAVQTGTVIGTAVNDVRTLGNLRHDEGTTSYFRQYMRRQLLSLPNVRLVAELQGAQLQKEGLNLLHAVGKGATEEPSLTVIEYNGLGSGAKSKKSNAGAVALVGKGVVFDSGGLNVKPFGSMETMHMDMMGAGCVLGALRTVALLKLPIRVVGVVALAENAIGPTAYHPSSILRALDGTTVEITNTDAEGRLILADALTYLQRLGPAQLTAVPHTIIDLATLTGAIVAALGDRRAGVFANSSSLLQQLLVAGARVNEPLWPMPVGAEHTKAMQGDLADLINCSAKREAGACTAAAFLKHFIAPGMKWAHLDIAGPAIGTKGKGVLPNGAPGFGVRLLVDYLRRNAAVNTATPTRFAGKGAAK